jgi:hypothetical protein
LIDSNASLLAQLRAGDRQLKMLAAGGLLPFPPDELIPLQVELTSGSDPEVAERARQTLVNLDPRIATLFLDRAAQERELRFFAAESSHPLILERIVRRRDVPRRILVDLARRLPPDLQEILLLRQDAILDEPAILDALAFNDQVSKFSLRRINEYREHLLPRQRLSAEDAARLRVEEEEIDEESFKAALEEARKAPVAGEIDTQTGLSEGQIRLLPVPARLKLTRGAPRMLRAILLRDTNAQVAVSVVMNNALSEQEVEQLANNRSIVEEVLEVIAKRKEWIGRYNVMKAVIQNPRTSLATAVKFIPRLSVRDLRELSRDRNVPDAVRSTATRLYRIKQR